jgi:predicted secreted protein
MNAVGGLVIYLVIWWAVFFTMLPIGVKSQAEAGTVIPGTDPGAPIAPNLWRKALWTSLIAAAIWAILFVAVALRWISFERLNPGGA